MNRILLIEPDFVLMKRLHESIKDNEIEVTGCGTIAAAIELLDREVYEVIIVDTELSDGDSYDLIYEIRRGTYKPKDASVIAIVPNNRKPDAVELGSQGIMDYVTKPFSTAVLLAKIYTQFDRKRKNIGFKASGRFEATGSAYPCSIKYEQRMLIDEYLFDFEKGKFSKAGKQIKLTLMEQALLRMLIENKGIVLKKKALISRLRTESRVNISESMLAGIVETLTEKLGAQSYIKTIFGVGYMWEYIEDKYKGGLM